MPLRRRTCASASPLWARIPIPPRRSSLPTSCAPTWRSSPRPSKPLGLHESSEFFAGEIAVDLARAVQRHLALADDLDEARVRVLRPFVQAVGLDLLRGGGCAALEDDERRGHVPLDRRSEERRVGKECRSRWSPYH